MPAPRTLARRLAPLALIAALGLLFLQTRSEKAAVELRFVAPERAAEVRGLRVELVQDGEAIGQFAAERVRPRTGGELGRWPLTATAGDHELRIAIELVDGARALRRSIDLTDGATITIDLDRDLAPAAP